MTISDIGYNRMIYSKFEGAAFAGAMLSGISFTIGAFSLSLMQDMSKDTMLESTAIKMCFLGSLMIVPLMFLSTMRVKELIFKEPQCSKPGNSWLAFFYSCASTALISGVVCAYNELIAPTTAIGIGGLSTLMMGAFTGYLVTSKKEASEPEKAAEVREWGGLSGLLGKQNDKTSFIGV